MIQSSVEGDPQKLQNSYPQACLPWATSIIARAGWMVWIYLSKTSFDAYSCSRFEAIWISL
ncbi:hypothetical protein FDUTEX481_07190 [Tolypothrix sp. PCC 7601]|nr:hypothetical protein FDUTEX481_07190 [Tolypothrix sp. PCC 7601]